jgi:AAA domain
MDPRETSRTELQCLSGGSHRSFGAGSRDCIGARAPPRARDLPDRRVPQCGFINDERIHFSDNLNCFIGGRGTGKSTAIRALAYGLNDEFADYDNCPDSLTAFSEDENGVLCRYLRSRGGGIDVKAKGRSFYCGCSGRCLPDRVPRPGRTRESRRGSAENPELFQIFLDRHTNLRDLLETEQAFVTSLRENAGRLLPLETTFAQLKSKKGSLEEIEKKLKIAEEGNLRDVVATQSKLASEKAVRESIEAIVTEYTNGHSLSSIQWGFDQILATVGTCTDDLTSISALAVIKIRSRTTMRWSRKSRWT